MTVDTVPPTSLRITQASSAKYNELLEVAYAMALGLQVEQVVPLPPAALYVLLAQQAALPSPATELMMLAEVILRTLLPVYSVT